MSKNQNETKQFHPLYWMKNPGITPKGDRRDFINPEWIPWTDWLMPGTYFKLLFCDLVSGNFTLLLKVDPDTKAAVHWHLHNTEAYIIEGGFYYDDGDDKGYAGYYTCESAGAIHEPFTSPEGVTMLAISHGPIGGYTDDGQLALMADARLHYLMARENGAVEHTTLVDYTHGSL
ncbi:2,4'-dihydroxyacetophenone dioxygenase family protein [Brevibacillus daliensis]|uniref:2,4'-dihydroxyacetophenone dioxygenase family protein n=1 Tax=Brevibacillus daliensis TaxID=2892995 RepID=UPI001E58DEF0|nr:2,4'-dihydroxyacetophenone dioxygenase family protein [Brevibacillus daliensis]